jgi:hypothetical protein
MESMTTHQKALDINKDTGRYGSFAEIGAGQEVARWFFRVGGAAGTIAKTMSAYDMKVSDAIYGTTERYVSSKRLLSMLDHEYDLTIERLDADRGRDTAFFSFADTVSAQNYEGTADCHGWMGIRFQTHPRRAASQIILHARMLDRDALMQQEALGVLGVNLVYGASRLAETPEILLASLLDNLDHRRLEIDMVEFSGPAFEAVDHRLISLHLVESRLSSAAMFSVSGEALRPSEVLYKSPVILQRGRFRPPTRVHADMQRRAHARFAKDLGVEPDQIISLLEISLRELRATSAEHSSDFLDRIEALTAGNHSVLVSDYPAYYLAAEYLARYGAREIALPIGIDRLQDVIREERYSDLPGGFLEAAGRLFSMKLRLYVYPGLDPSSGRRLTLENFEAPKSVASLFGYLVEKGLVRSLEGLPDDQLRLTSDEILARLRSGDLSWEAFVEPEVVFAIKAGGLFGYGAARR